MKRVLILTCAIAGLATGAFAQSKEKSTEEVLAAVKVDAADAVKAAEAHTQGKVTSLDIDQDDKTGEPYYDVEVVDNSGKEHKLEVNGVSGAVSDARADSDHKGEDRDAD